MNVDEIVDLLSMIVAYDNRKLSESSIPAWLAVAERAEWSFEEAKIAVTEHYSHSTEWLMPAHITRIIRERRKKGLHLPEWCGQCGEGQLYPDSNTGEVVNPARKNPNFRFVGDNFGQPCPRCHPAVA